VCAVENLETRILVVCVSNVERLSGEGIWLHFNISACDLIHKTGLAHVRVTAEDDCTSSGINARKTSKMLADLFQVG
jgi:hypothetical protein